MFAAALLHLAKNGDITLTTAGLVWVIVLWTVVFATALCAVGRDR